MTKQRPKQAQARSYYRIAGKFSRQGDFGMAKHYRQVADRLVDQDRREQEAKANLAKSRAAWAAKMAARKAAQEVAS